MLVMHPKYIDWRQVPGNIDLVVPRELTELAVKKSLAQRCLEVVRTSPTLTAKEQEAAHQAMLAFMHHEPNDAVHFFPGCKAWYYRQLAVGLRTARLLAPHDPLCQEYVSHLRRFRDEC